MADKIISMPDGSTVAFPDSMSDDQINSALTGWKPQGGANAAPAAPAPVASPWLRYPLMGLSDLVKGTGELIDFPRTISSQASNALTAGANAITGANVPANFGVTTPSATAGLQALGIADNPRLAPQGTAENLLSAGVTAAPFALLDIASGGAATPALMTAMSSGIGAEAGHEIFPNSKIAPIIGGMAGGYGAQAARSMFTPPPVEAVASKLGSSETPQQAGAAAQEAARTWKLETMPAKLDAVSGPLDAAIPAETPVPLTNYREALAGINKRAPSVQGQVNLLTESLPRQLEADLNKAPLESLLGGPAETTTPSWSDARVLRSVIGDSMSHPKIIQAIGSQNISNLYRAITEDLGNVAEKQGAGEAWDNFNTESNRLYKFASGPLSKLISTTNAANETIAPESAASALLSSGKKGGTALQALRLEVPDAVDELAAAHLRGASPWRNLSPEAREALVPDPGDRQILSAAIPATKPSAPTGALHAIVGEAAGHSLATLAGRAAGMAENSLIPGAIGDIAGLVAPSLWRGAKGATRNILLNPQYQKSLAVGAAVGASKGQAQQ